MDWAEQFDIIKQKSEAILAGQGKKFSLSAMENLLGVTRGKATHWTKGQVPCVSDLKAIAEFLGLSPEWLLLGNGDPDDRTVGIVPMPPAGWPGRPCVVRDHSGVERVTGNIVPVAASSGCEPVDLNARPGLSNDKTCIPAELYGPGLKVFRAEEDVMDPLIRHGAWVGVDTAITKIQSGQLYAFTYLDNDVAFREVHMDIATGQVILRAADARHPEVVLGLEDYKNRVLGKVSWVIQKF